MTRLAFVDVETTGMDSASSRIIDIGIVLSVDGQAINKFSSLVDPDTQISPFATRLTGITQFELEKAPTFRNISDQVSELLSGAIFVAHNVGFDYGFIVAEFARLGIRFKSPHLCTARLSRSLFPYLPHHNLDTLIEHFNLPVSRRHRALSDAESIYYLINFITRHVDQQKLVELGWN